MQLNEEQKKHVSKAVQEYSENKGISLNEIGRKSKVNPSFVSQIVNEKGEVKDRWYIQLAEFVGYKLEKKYWETVPTPQFREIITHIEDARNTVKPRVIIGNTGCGKTFTIKRYLNANPVNTFCITVSNLHRLNDVLNEMLEILGLPIVSIKITKLRKIIDKFILLRREGIQPILILDESENMNLCTIQMLKTLYDFLQDYCPIILIGTDQLIKKIEKLKNRNKDGMPQFYRRFKAGIRYLPEIDTTFKQFLNVIDVTDKRLIRLLKNLCSNYGELNDYTEFALKEADRIGKKLDYDLFIEIYNLRKEVV